ncbi:hypothetical protein HS7_12920 [Sulfolobales archaeon HS-7]|nr:hypothetical protein HS7_12920 [Sulfolobales archaeon HS-7]
MNRVAKALVGLLFLLLIFYMYLVYIPSITEHVNTKFFVNWHECFTFIAYCKRMSYSKQYSVGLLVPLTPQNVNKYLNLSVEPKSAVLYPSEPIELKYQVLAPTTTNLNLFGFYMNPLTTNTTCNISITKLNLSYDGTWFEKLGEINKSFIYPCPPFPTGSIPVITYNNISMSINAYLSSDGVPVKSLVYCYQTNVSTYLNGFEISGTLTKITYGPFYTSPNQYLMTVTIIGGIKDLSNGLVIRGSLTLVNYTGKVFVNVRPSYVSNLKLLDEVMGPNFAVLNVTALNSNTPEFVTPVPLNVPGEIPYNSTFNYIELQFLQNSVKNGVVLIPSHYYNVSGSNEIFTAIPAQDEILPGIVFALT